MPRRRDNPYAPHDWAPHEKPALLGSPSTPLHSPAKRLAYGVVGLLVCLTGALGNAVVTANLQLLQGTFAAPVDRNRPAAGGIRDDQRLHQPAAGEIPPAVWPARFHRRLSGALCAGHLFHLFVNDLSSAMMVRAAHGMVAAALSSLGIYYRGTGTACSASPERADYRHHRLVASHSLARLFSTELLQTDEWRGLYFFELGTALVSLACVIALKLPPSDRKKSVRKKGFHYLLSAGARHGAGVRRAVAGAARVVV